MRVVLFLMLILFSVAVFAQDDGKVKTIDIRGDEGEHIVLKITEGKGVVATDGTTGEVVGEVDFEELEEAIESAVGNVGTALEELKEMQITVEVGKDNKLKIAKEDEEVVVDVDVIIDGIGAAIKSLGEIDAIKHINVNAESITAEELDEEIAKLRQEVRELREALAKEQNKEN